MSEKLFREKNLKRIQSPDRLNDTIKVVNPGVWMLLAAMILLLAGALCWSVLGTMDVTLPAEAGVSADHVCLTVAADKQTALKSGMKVRIVVDGENTVECILPQSTTFQTVEQNTTAFFEAPVHIPDGSYSALIITEEIRPLSFLLN